MPLSRPSAPRLFSVARPLVPLLVVVAVRFPIVLVLPPVSFPTTRSFRAAVVLWRLFVRAALRPLWRLLHLPLIIQLWPSTTRESLVPIRLCVLSTLPRAHLAPPSDRTAAVTRLCLAAVCASLFVLAAECVCGPRATRPSPVHFECPRRNGAT